jgi:hypothetical protein
MSHHYMAGEHVFKARHGLLPEKVWDGLLSDYDTRFVRWLREELAIRVDGLTEKFNDARGRHYFGYSSAGLPDWLYIWVQKRKLVVDVKLSGERVGQLRSLGFTVSLRRNWQGRAGWLTGWDIPYDLGWEKRQAILEIMLEAL